MKYTRTAKQWYKKWSTWGGLLSAVTAIQGVLPLWEGIIPEYHFMIASAVLATAVPLLTSIKQANIDD